MRNYELALILSPKLDKEGQDKVLGKIKNFILEGSGEIFGVDEWGKKDLSYPIKGQKEGFYYILSFSCDSGKIGKFMNDLNIYDGIIRYLLIAKNKKEIRSEESVKVEKSKKKRG